MLFSTLRLNIGAHQSSHAIVADPKALLIVFEALGVQRMTRKPKAKQDEKRAGKLAIEVPPHRSSQECSACGHTHPDDRPAQAGFVCQCCGHTGNADFNASKVVRGRGVKGVNRASISFSAGNTGRSRARKRRVWQRRKVTPQGRVAPVGTKVKSLWRHRQDIKPVTARCPGYRSRKAWP